MKITRYTIKGKTNVKIALVSDLHEYDPSDIITTLKEIRPDIICTPGDMMERHDHGSNPREHRKGLHLFVHILLRSINNAFKAIADLFDLKSKPSKENAYVFFKEASKIAPIFYSLGNHEWYLTDEDKAFFNENHITVLDHTTCIYKDMEIGGVSSDDPITFKTDNYKLLLCHQPEKYPIFKDKADIILSGHAHGGQIWLFNKPLFAPGQGFFPKFSRGKYDKMIVSAGTSNTLLLPRFNNPCEIVCIEVNKQETL